MQKDFLKNKNGGYAILFTVAVVAVISLITMGLSNAAYKQMVLSSVARDSTKAFYEADIASECALFADNIEYYNTNPSGSIFTCAEHDLIYTKEEPSIDTKIYKFMPDNPILSEKCFNSSIQKKETIDSINTVIETRGYNICNTSHIRTVERAIRVTY